MKMNITWPSGMKQEFSNLRAGFRYDISEGTDKISSTPFRTRPAIASQPEVTPQNQPEFASTWLLEPLLASPGVLTQRGPTEQELNNIAYGRAVATNLAQHDIGQTVVIADSACVALEAMEGTDATIERAGHIMRSLHGDASTLSRTLTVVKIAKPNQDMRFDVPVIGVKTIEVMQAAGATCLAVDAGKCLMLDGQKVIDAANAAAIAIIADEGK